MSLADSGRFDRGMQRENELSGFYRQMQLKLGKCGASLPENAKLLEVGSGGGNLAGYLRKQGLSVEAVDLIPRAPDVQQADIAKLPYKNGSFDCIISKQVFDGALYEQSEEKQRVMLHEIARVLKQGGIYYASENFFEDVEELEQLSDGEGNQPPYVFRKVGSEAPRSSLAA